MSITAITMRAAIEAAIITITPTRFPLLKYWNAGSDSVPVEEQAATQLRRFDTSFGGGELGDIHVAGEDESVELIIIAVQYPGSSNLGIDENTVRQDVADIKSALNNPTSWASDVTHQIVIAWPAPVWDSAKQVWLQTIVARVRFMEAV